MRLRCLNMPQLGLKLSIAMIVAIGALSPGKCHAQFNNNNFRGVVGGVRIDADGVVRTATEQELNTNFEQLRAQLVGAQGDLAKPTDRRLISLKQLQRTLVDAANQNKSLPEEVLFLGGLTRIENVFVFPDRHDIVIAGPSEPWKLGANGSVVGVKSGKPVVYLEDLLCAFRTVMEARKTGISVSIEPTPEGAANLNRLLSNLAPGTNPRSLEQSMMEAFGPQQIKLEGVSSDSHLAHVILAADYRMKLYGMNLAKAPVKGLPSYIEMIQNRSTSAAQLQSRWWMACDYNSLEHSADKLAWKISGRGIKTLTEQEQINAMGNVKQTGKVDATAKRWADLFTQKLDDLAAKDPVFGELRNVMDLCVVAALIQSQNLQSLADCDLSAMVGDSAKVAIAQCDTPKSLTPQISFLQSAQGWVVSASGGVMVDSWQVVENTKVNNDLENVRQSITEWSAETQVWQ